MVDPVPYTQSNALLFRLRQLVEDAREGTAASNILISHITNGSTTNMNGDYSVTPQTFKLQPPIDKVYKVRRVLPFVVDSGTFDADKYGNNITLTNGIEFRVSDDAGVTKDLLDGETIKTNSDWKKYCYDITISDFGVGNETLGGRWTFSKFVRNGIVLDGSNNERLEMVLNDDFTGLIEHYLICEGSIDDA